jgi:predicted phosphodiesterase
MKLLVFSDIHNNLAVVRALRAAEANEYDALIVAGDLGDKAATQMFEIFDTFECPVFFVHGNWDNKLSYTQNPSTFCTQVHNNVYQLGDYFITGYSGCPTHWGKNPIYLKESAAARERHSEVLVQLQALHDLNDVEGGAIEEDFKRRRQLLSAKRAKMDSKAYRKAGQKLRDWKSKKLSNLQEKIYRLQKTSAYSKFEEDSWDCVEKTRQKQREELFKCIAANAIPHDRVIVLTHERLYRLADDGIVPLLHIFGHKHQYKFNKFKGTNYLNAAALDSSKFVDGEGWTVSPSGYCVVTLSNADVIVERRTVDVPETELEEED